MITHTSTAGRELTHPFETRDCTVVALAHSAGITYADAHKLCAESGRRNRGGMTNGDIQITLDRMKRRGQILDVIATPYKSFMPAFSTCTPRVIQGYRMYARRPRRTGTTVASALRTLPRKGRFYLTCTSHAFAYVDGVLLDNLGKSKMRALMTSCWEVIPVPKAFKIIVAAPKANVWTPLPASERPRFSAEGYHARVIAARMEYQSKFSTPVPLH